jgi:hypothetical protein
MRGSKAAEGRRNQKPGGSGMGLELAEYVLHKRWKFDLRISGNIVSCESGTYFDEV